jgi:LmbE family N-acetylglucosaminyl deacetylase
VLVVLVTAGDGYVEAVVHETGRPRPRPSQYVAYGKRRLRESRTALRVLGGGRVRLEFLGFPDGGLDRLLHIHWQRSHPERSLTTGASDPPYPDALEPDVPYDGADLRRELVDLLRATTPTIVALPDPLDRHPDHSAAGLFTLLALDDWLGQSAPRSPPTAPRLLAYLVHWPDWPPGWDAPTPPLDVSDAALELPRNLPLRGLGRTALPLTDDEISAKRTALAKYVSQQEAMAVLLAAFVRRTEPFTVLTGADLQHIEQMIEHARRPKRAPR